MLGGGDPVALADGVIRIAVAKMADGSFVQDQKTVKVTIGGCGG